MAANIHIVFFYDTIQFGGWIPTFWRNTTAYVSNDEVWTSSLKGGGSMFSLLGGYQQLHLQG